MSLINVTRSNSSTIIPCFHDGCVMEASDEEGLCVFHSRVAVKSLSKEFVKIHASGGIRESSEGWFQGCDLGECNIDGWHFFGCNFRNARFYRIYNSTFSDCDMTGCDFEAAVVHHCNFKTSILKDIRWHGCQFSTVFFPPEDAPQRCIYHSEALELKGRDRKESFRKAENVYRDYEKIIGGGYYKLRMDMRHYTVPIYTKAILSFMNYTCEYGENPGRYLLLIVMIIFVFAFLLWPTSIHDAQNNPPFSTALYLSFCVFSGMIPSDIQIHGIGRAIVCIERFIGLFSIAPLIFCVFRVFN